MSSDITIRIHDIGKKYRLYSSPSDRLKERLFRNRRAGYQEFEALKGINFTVGKGEVVGIVGRNGSGKSTLLQIICGTLMPSSGEVETKGRVAALLELGSGFDPKFTGRENVFLNASILGLSRDEINQRYDNIIAFADIGEFINRPVKTYSSGMYVRLAFAVAMSVEPDILIVDEALAVGDDAFRRKCYAKIEEIKNRGGSILFVSHSASMITNLCSRAILLDAGELLLTAKPKKIISLYHKLTNAEAEKQNAIREEIKRGKESVQTASRAGGLVGVSSAEDTVAAPIESAVWFEERGARISNPRICSLDDKVVNMLETGKQYICKFDVFFSKDVSDVGFAMAIKSVDGVILGGARTPKRGDLLLNSVTSGSRMQFGFKFRCILLDGAYFFNVGVSAASAEGRITLHRGVDVLMCTVLPNESLAVRLVDFECSPLIQNI